MNHATKRIIVFTVILVCIMVFLPILVNVFPYALPVLVGLAAAGIILAVDYLIAKSFSEIARDKGYANRKYFHFCFWLGIAGWIMVAALPDRKTVPQQTGSNGNDQEKRDPPASDYLNS